MTALKSVQAPSLSRVLYYCTDHTHTHTPHRPDCIALCHSIDTTDSFFFFLSPICKSTSKNSVFYPQFFPLWQKSVILKKKKKKILNNHLQFLALTLISLPLSPCPLLPTGHSDDSLLKL